MSTSGLSIDTSQKSTRQSSTSKSPKHPQITYEKDKDNGQIYMKVVYNDELPFDSSPIVTPRGTPHSNAGTPPHTNWRSGGDFTLSGLVTNDHFKHIFDEDQFEMGFANICAEANSDNDSNVKLNFEENSVEFSVKVCGVWCKFPVDLHGEMKRDESPYASTSTAGDSSPLISPPHESRKKSSKRGHYNKPNKPPTSQVTGNYANMRPTNSRPNHSKSSNLRQKSSPTSGGEQLQKYVKQAPPDLKKVHSAYVGHSSSNGHKKDGGPRSPLGFANVDQMKSQDLLRYETQGTYLVRFSGSRPHNHKWYVISYYNNIGELRHHRVKLTKIGWIQGDEGAPSVSHGCKTVKEYVDTYLKSSGALYPIIYP